MMGDLSPPQLLDLPNEILHEIFTLFCEHCTDAPPDDTGGHRAQCRKALAATARTCRKLRDVVSTIIPHFMELDSEQLRSSGLHFATLYLLTFPEMVQYVKQVVIQPLPHQSQSSLAHYSRTDWDWMMRNSWCGLEKMFALLKNFDLRIEGPGLLRLPEMILQRPYIEYPPRLDNLKVLELDTDLSVPIIEDIEFNTLTYWRSCCYWAERLSDLHTLRLINLFTTWDNEPEHGAIAHTVPCRLRVLEFKNCALENESGEQLMFLTRMIEQNEHLERFAFSLGASESYGTDDSPGPMPPSKIVLALSSRKSTLRVLDLDFLDPFQPADTGSSHILSKPSPFGTHDLAKLTIRTHDWYVSPSLMTSFTALEELSIDEQSFCKRWMHPVVLGRPESPVTGLSGIISQSVKKLVIRLKLQTLATYEIFGLGLEVANGKFPNLQNIVIVTKINVTKTDHVSLSTSPVFSHAVRQAERLQYSMTRIKVNVDAQVQVRAKPQLVFCISEARQIIGE